MSSTYGYQPAHQLSSTGGAQTFEFDDANTIAKQQQFQQAGGFQPAGGFPQGGLSAPPPPPALPQSSLSSTRGNNLNLRTRNWNNQPWAGAQTQGETYRPPSSIAGNSFGSSRSGFGSSYPSSGLNSGFPSSNYTPSSTIPLRSNYQLPSSQLAQSSGPFDSSFNNSGINQTSSNIPTPPALPTWNNSGYGSNGNNIRLRTNNWGQRTENGWSNFRPQNVQNEQFLNNSNYPVDEFANQSLGNQTFGNQTFGNQSLGGFGNQSVGNQNIGGFGNQTFNNQSIGNQSFGGQGLNNVPVPPPVPSFNQRQSALGQRNFHTRNWGSRNENGWSGLNNGLYANEAALPFNQNRTRLSQQQFGSQGIIPQQQFNQGILPQQQLGSQFGSQGIIPQQQFGSQGIIPQQQFGSQGIIPQQQFGSQGISAAPISTIPISAAPISTIPISSAPIAGAPVGAGAPLTGRKGKRYARKQAKQQAIASKLTTHLNPPVGDPAVNHYRRGAHATVPIVGPATGVAPPTGSIRSRRQGRRNNLGRRRGRTAGPALPVAATQPPFVAPVPVAPVYAQPIYPATSYTTGAPLTSVYSTGAPLSSGYSTGIPLTSGYSTGAPLASGYSSVPLSSAGIPYSSSAGIPLSTQGQQPLYSGLAQQSNPLSSTLTNSQGTVSNAPLYSAKEPVAGHMLNKQAQAPVYTRPTGSATF